MDEYDEARGWTILFLTGLYQSLWRDFFYSFIVMPKVIWTVITGEREGFIDHVVGRISLRVHEANPPPPSFCEKASESPKEAMFLLGWAATTNLWFCPRIRVDIVVKLSPIIERKWYFRGWLT